MTGAHVILFPQARRVGFIRRLAGRVDRVARSAEAAGNIIGTHLRQQRAAMERRAIPPEEIDAALGALAGSIAREIARLRMRRGGAA